MQVTLENEQKERRSLEEQLTALQQLQPQIKVKDCLFVFQIRILKEVDWIYLTVQEVVRVVLESTVATLNKSHCSGCSFTDREVLASTQYLVELQTTLNIFAVQEVETERGVLESTVATLKLERTQLEQTLAKEQERADRNKIHHVFLCRKNLNKYRCKKYFQQFTKTGKTNKNCLKFTGSKLRFWTPDLMPHSLQQEHNWTR